MYIAPSPVQDTLVTLVDDIINITWSPPAIPNGVIHQYIVQRINSSGTFYYHVPADTHHISLPYVNDALIFVSAVNLFGQSKFTQALPNGMVSHLKCIKCHHFIYVAPCLPSPCLNNGICVALKSNHLQQSPCTCVGIYSGKFCENGDKVSAYIRIRRSLRMT